MDIDPKKLSPRDSYSLLVSAITPRPIAFVTSTNEQNTVNAAPYSFFNALSGNPPLIMISVGRKMGKMKHTSENILRQREFVVNLVTEELVHPMNIASADFPPGISEIEQAHLALLPSLLIHVPRIAGASVSCECILHRHLEVGNEPTDLIIGEIVQFHVKDELYAKGIVDQRLFKPVARMGGNFYSKTSETFELERFRYDEKLKGKN